MVEIRKLDGGIPPDDEDYVLVQRRTSGTYHVSGFRVVEAGAQRLTPEGEFPKDEAIAEARKWAENVGARFIYIADS